MPHDIAGVPCRDLNRPADIRCADSLDDDRRVLSNQITERCTVPSIPAAAFSLALTGSSSSETHIDVGAAARIGARALARVRNDAAAAAAAATHQSLPLLSPSGPGRHRSPAHYCSDTPLQCHAREASGVTLAAACYLTSPPIIAAALALGLRAS